MTISKLPSIDKTEISNRCVSTLHFSTRQLSCHLNSHAKIHDLASTALPINIACLSMFAFNLSAYEANTIFANSY